MTDPVSASRSDPGGAAPRPSDAALRSLLNSDEGALRFAREMLEETRLECGEDSVTFAEWDGTVSNLVLRMSLACEVLELRSRVSPTAPLTYHNQPNNDGAWELGLACRYAAEAQRAGDPIDRGLLLLLELEKRGFGVVRLADTPARVSPTAAATATTDAVSTDIDRLTAADFCACGVFFPDVADGISAHRPGCARFDAIQQRIEALPAFHVCGDRIGMEKAADGQWVFLPDVLRALRGPVENPSFASTPESSHG